MALTLLSPIVVNVLLLHLLMDHGAAALDPHLLDLASPVAFSAGSAFRGLFQRTTLQAHRASRLIEDETDL